MYDEAGSLFEGGDEFGIDSAREDFDYLFSMNKVKVQLLRHNIKMDQNMQGELMGDTTTTPPDHTNWTEYIYIVLTSNEPDTAEIEQQGYESKGQVIFTGFARYDTDIDNNDRVKFVYNHKYGIKSGETFKIKLDEAGLYQGQYTFRKFTLTRI